MPRFGTSRSCPDSTSVECTRLRSSCGDLPSMTPFARSSPMLRKIESGIPTTRFDTSSKCRSIACRHCSSASTMRVSSVNNFLGTSFLRPVKSLTSPSRSPGVSAASQWRGYGTDSTPAFADFGVTLRLRSSLVTRPADSAASTGITYLLNAFTHADSDCCAAFMSGGIASAVIDGKASSAARVAHSSSAASTAGRSTSSHSSSSAVLISPPRSGRCSVAGSTSAANHAECSPARAGPGRSPGTRRANRRALRTLESRRGTGTATALAATS